MAQRWSALVGLGLVLMSTGGVIGTETRRKPAQSLIGTVTRQDMKGLHQICECEFYRGPIDGTTTVLATWEGRTRALARIKERLTRLELAKSAGDTECRANAELSQSWRAEAMTVLLQLSAERPGEEACWYRGTMHVTTRGRTEVLRITGACGC
jgi:hypothetical protein